MVRLIREWGNEMARDIETRIDKLENWHHDRSSHRLARHLEFNDVEAAIACHEELVRHIWKRVRKQSKSSYLPLLTFQGLEVRVYLTGHDDGLGDFDLDLAESIEELAGELRSAVA